AANSGEGRSLAGKPLHGHRFPARVLFALPRLPEVFSAVRRSALPQSQAQQYHKRFGRHVTPGDRARPPAVSPAYSQAASGATSSGGSLNWIFSSVPARVEISTGPKRHNVAITSSTSTSGADAPAVSPMVLRPTSHSGFTSLPSATK